MRARNTTPTPATDLDKDDAQLERILNDSKMDVGMSIDDGWNRRRLLRGLGVGVAALVGLETLAFPSPASALTTDVIRDQGGAVFNVMAYGADNSGSAGTQAAIASAISAAQSAGGGIVYFPTGTYRIDSALTITGNGVTFMGAGMGATSIKAGPSFASDNMIFFNQVKYGRVLDLTVDSTNPRTGPGTGIKFDGITAGSYTGTVAAEHIVHNVWLNNQFVSISLAGQMFLTHVDRVYITNMTANGVGIDINTTDANHTPGVSQYISNVFLNGGTDVPANQPLAAVRVRSTGDYTLRSVSSIFTRYGLLVDPPSGDSVAAGFHEGCLWDTCGLYGVFIRPEVGGSGTVQSLGFVDCWTSGERTYDGVYIAGNVKNVQFTAHRSYANRSWGFACQGNVNTQNIFLDAFEGLSNDVDNHGSGGVLFQDADGFAVRNSYMGQGYGSVTQKYGIRTSGSCDNYLIANNLVRGMLTAAISDTASGTNKFVGNNVTL